MKLIFQLSRYPLNRSEYEALWASYGNRIKKSFKKIIGLPFKEENIMVLVGDYESNFAGKSVEEPMRFRYSVRHKLGTIFHELSHRFLLEYKFSYGEVVTNDHELIDLFLYDVIKDCFGKAAADERIRYELTFPQKEIVNSWNKILSKTFKERQKLLKDIIYVNNSLKKEISNRKKNSITSLIKSKNPFHQDPI